MVVFISSCCPTHFLIRCISLRALIWYNLFAHPIGLYCTPILTSLAPFHFSSVSPFAFFTHPLSFHLPLRDGGQVKHKIFQTWAEPEIFYAVRIRSASTCTGTPSLPTALASAAFWQNHSTDCRNLRNIIRIWQPWAC